MRRIVGTSPTSIGSTVVGRSWVALGLPRLSTRSSEDEPARPKPTWTSHGHTGFGRAAIVIARVAVDAARPRRSSPGIDAPTSARVAPQCRRHRR